MTFEPGLSLLVPTDFTEKSNQALEVAAKLLKDRGGVIQSLHVVDYVPELRSGTIDSARFKLGEYVQNQYKKLNVTIIPNIVTGNIFNAIGETASKLRSNLIVMGVHGMHGIQFVIGSFAARVILGSEVPVLMISSSHHFKGFNNVVLPLNLKMKVEKIVSKAIEMGLQYGSIIHIFASIDNTSLVKKILLKAELKSIERAIRRSGVNVTSKLVYNGKSDVVDYLLDFSREVEASMIMMFLQSEPRSREFLVGRAENLLIQKSKIPLYIINPFKNFEQTMLYRDFWGWHKG